MINRFNYIFRYNSIESIIYQFTLLTHQLLLFSTISYTHYGRIGTIFSLIYLAVLYTNGGLDVTIAPFFHQAKQHKHLFYVLIIQQLAINITLISFVLAICFCLFQLGILTIHISWVMYFLCGSLVLTESIKKTLKTVLQLALYVKAIALIEITMLWCYVSCVWLLIYVGYSINMILIFGPMALISCLNMLLFAFLVFSYYNTLKSDNPTTAILFSSILSKRIKNYIYQLSHSWYSANFLVPFFALQYGVELVALLKLVSMAAYAINSIIQHIFGVTSDTLLANCKHKAATYKQQLFNYLTTYLFHVLYILFLFLCINHRVLAFVDPTLGKEQLYIIYLFLLVIFSENIVLTHERFFIIEEKTPVLILCNVSLILPLYLVREYLFLSACNILSLLLIMRLCSFLMLYVYGKYACGLQLSWPLRPLYFSASVGFAFICLLCS